MNNNLNSTKRWYKSWPGWSIYVVSPLALILSSAALLWPRLFPPEPEYKYRIEDDSTDYLMRGIEDLVNMEKKEFSIHFFLSDINPIRHPSRKMDKVRWDVEIRTLEVMTKKEVVSQTLVRKSAEIDDGNIKDYLCSGDKVRKIKEHKKNWWKIEYIKGDKSKTGWIDQASAELSKSNSDQWKIGVKSVHVRKDHKIDNGNRSNLSLKPKDILTVIGETNGFIKVKTFFNDTTVTGFVRKEDLGGYIFDCKSRKPPIKLCANNDFRIYENTKDTLGSKNPVVDKSIKGLLKCSIAQLLECTATEVREELKTIRELGPFSAYSASCLPSRIEGFDKLFINDISLDQKDKYLSDDLDLKVQSNRQLIMEISIVLDIKPDIEGVPVEPQGGKKWKALFYLERT